MDLFIDVLQDSVLDTLKLIPFLLVTYLAMEALEHAAGAKVRAIVERADHSGPVVGSILGALPQCGFSAMAATLFAGRVVTAGTLVAVILSTSDEMIPVFVAHQAEPGRMGSIILVKVVLGIVCGLGLDFVLRESHHNGDGRVHIHELCEREHCHCDEECDDEEMHEEECCGHCCCHGEDLVAGVREGCCHGEDLVANERGCCGGHEHEVPADGVSCCGVHACDGHACDDRGNASNDPACHDHADHSCGGHDHAADAHSHDAHHHHGHGIWGIVRCALVHTVQVTVFIFLITFAFGLIIEGVGQDAIASLLADHPVRATFLSALIGLIPNCGASVAISELFIDGVLGTGPMLAGLLSSGGVGLLVLWRTNDNPRQNLLITGLVYVASVVAGLVAVAFGILL